MTALGLNKALAATNDDEVTNFEADGAKVEKRMVESRRVKEEGLISGFEMIDGRIPEYGRQKL